jgi:hypothetical protein
MNDRLRVSQAGAATLRAAQNRTASHVAAQLVKSFDFLMTYRHEDSALVDARGQRISDVSFYPEDGPSIAAELNAGFERHGQVMREHLRARAPEDRAGRLQRSDRWRKPED